jgi:diguanylate cyclase
MLGAKKLVPVMNPAQQATNGIAVHLPWLDSQDEEVGLDSIAPLARPASPVPPGDFAMRDWDELLRTVKARLRHTIADRLAASSPDKQQVTELAGRVQASVVECVSAMDQLHATLKYEIGRRRQLEVDVFHAQNALAQSRVELMGTQAGERRARHQALHDSLTALPNRRHFGERLEHALAIAQPEHQSIAVVYLDLDAFKPINDVHGHDAGDELLRIVAARLARAVRAEDMVSRLGGDEFACLLTELPPGRMQLTRLARKLFDAVSAPFKIGKLRLTVRPSIGISMYPGDGLTADALMKNADTAMYRAKRQQTAYEFFDQAAET